jgi:hypothetical protein
MFVPFESLIPASRIWIFQANRRLAPAELELVDSNLREFTEEWGAHGSPLKTSFTVKFEQFIILAADETHQNPSGCSIDSSVRVLKGLEQSLGIQLFDRNQVAFNVAGQVILVPLTDLKQKFQEGILNKETLTFNNLAGTKAELEKAWLVPAGLTWLRRYIPNELANVK